MVAGEGHGYVRGLGKLGGENGIAGEENFFFPCLCVSRGRRSTMSFKTALLRAFLFLLFFNSA